MPGTATDTIPSKTLLLVLVLVLSILAVAAFGIVVSRSVTSVAPQEDMPFATETGEIRMDSPRMRKLHDPANSVANQTSSENRNRS